MATAQAEVICFVPEFGFIALNQHLGRGCCNWASKKWNRFLSLAKGHTFAGVEHL